MEKVKGEKGIKYIPVMSEKLQKQKSVKNKKVKNKKVKNKKVMSEKAKMILAILKEFEKEKEDRDELYLKRKEGCYEKYIKKNFPDTLEPKKYDKKYGYKKVVVFMDDKKIYAIKNITVYYNGGEKTARIKKYTIKIKRPEFVEEKLKYNGKMIKRDDLYRAILKTNTITCDVWEMVEGGNM